MPYKMYGFDVRRIVMYKLPVIKMYKEQMEKIVKQKYPVVVVGCGRLGKVVVDLLLDKNISVKYIFDNNKSFLGQSYKGIDILLPEKLSDENTSYIVAVYNYMEPIRLQLENLGCKNIYPYYCCFDGQEISEEFYWDNDGSIQDAVFYEAYNKLDIKGNPLVIDTLDLAITERCSLRCENCANLIQYYTKPVDGDVCDNLKALKRLLQCVDLIGSVHILGGEPLLCEKLPSYVEACVETDKIANIVVISNGTISLKEELVRVLKSDDRCVFSISNYGSLSSKKDEIILTSRNEQFKISVSRRDGIWRELGKIHYIDLSEGELARKWEKCMMKKALSLKDGKLFICPFASNAYSLQAVRKDNVEYIDLLDGCIGEEELKERIRTFISKNIHMECKYCIEKGIDAKIVPAAAQIKKPMDYIKYTY